MMKYEIEYGVWAVDEGTRAVESKEVADTMIANLKKAGYRGGNVELRLRVGGRWLLPREMED